MQLLIRRYHPSDKDAVRRLFSVGIREHIRPCFQKAMTSSMNLTITLSLCFVGYLLGSLFVVVLLTAAWAGLVYYCCHQLYSGYVAEKLGTDMQDIVGSYLSQPDDCFWVAEAEGRVIGMVAVVCTVSGNEKHGELFRMIISPQCRRMGIAKKLTQTVIDFCKERGFSKLVLETSYIQVAAVALYEKLGFKTVFTHKETYSPSWVVLLARMTILKMEKHL